MKKIKVGIFILILITGTILLRGVFSGSKNIFSNNAVSYLVKPVGQIFSGAGWWFKDKIIFLTSIGNLKNDNQKLFDKNLELMSQVTEMAEIKKENDILRREISIAPREKYKLASAMIIGREIGNNSEIIYINKGEKDGLKKGMAVLAGKGVLIGVINEVSAKISKVKLITDKEFKVNAKLVESDGHGIVSGQYGTSVMMKMIPQTVEVNEGDTVITSELSDIFKEGILIGYVQEVSSTADGLFQEATILLPRKLENLHLVHILLE